MRRVAVFVALVFAIAGAWSATGTAAPGAAAKPAPKLPPAPIKCQAAGGGGCYGWTFGPEYMDNTFIGEMTVSPHIVKAGQSINVEMQVISSPDWGTPVADEPCHDAHCSIKMTSPTSAWLRFPGTFCFNPRIACGTEQEAVYVLDGDQYAISGVVRSFDGKGAGPGLRVDISPGFFALTEVGGFYQALLPKGRYSVSGPDGYCVGSAPKRGACQRSATVALTDQRGAVAVDFYEETHRVSGKVTESECRQATCKRTPAAGITVVATSGAHTVEDVTGKDGKYSLKVGSGPVAIKPGPGDDFDPAERLLIVRKDTLGVDFNRCITETSDASSGEPDPCPTVLITGKVKDVSGRPANLFCLFFVGGRGRSYDAVTNSDGLYAVEVPRGTYTVQSNYLLTDVHSCRHQSVLDPLRTTVKATKPRMTLNLRTTPTVDAAVVNLTKTDGSYDRLFVVVHSPPAGAWHLSIYFMPRGSDCARDVFEKDADAGISWVEFELRAEGSRPGFCPGQYRLMVSRPDTLPVILHCTLIAVPNDPWDTQPWYGSEPTEGPSSGGHPSDPCPVRRGFGTPQG
jgi:hypothetical protein